MAQITIPVFTKMNLDQDIGGPATIIDTMSAEAGAVLASLVVDQMSLNLCVQSIQALLTFGASWRKPAVENKRLSPTAFSVWQISQKICPLISTTWRTSTKGY